MWTKVLEMFSGRILPKITVNRVQTSTPHITDSNESSKFVTPSEIGFNPSMKSSKVTSTPKELDADDKDDLDKKIKELKEKREELIASLQADERERQWHYTQLELISQKTRSIHLTSSQSYSLDNELQRQQLEERASRVKASMLATLGRPEDALARRRARVGAISNIDNQLSGLQHQGGGIEMRARGSGARSERQPTSCNLEQLCHQALPGSRQGPVTQRTSRAPQW